MCKTLFQSIIKGSSKMTVFQFPDVTIIHCDRCGEDRDGELLIPTDVYGICSDKQDFDDDCHYVCWDCLTDNEENDYHETNPPTKLSDYARGDLHCRMGKPHLPGQSKEYDHAYGARYIKEQMDDAKLEYLNKFNEKLLGL